MVSTGYTVTFCGTCGGRLPKCTMSPAPHYVTYGMSGEAWCTRCHCPPPRDEHEVDDDLRKVNRLLDRKPARDRHAAHTMRDKLVAKATELGILVAVGFIVGWFIMRALERIWLR